MEKARFATMNLLGHSLSVCENVNEKFGEVGESLRMVQVDLRTFCYGVNHKWILSTNPFTDKSASLEQRYSLTVTRSLGRKRR